ncbi:MAG: hypothetical protein IPH06_13560 [Alphaproteobacteria bacterium]|nr:hypothetical protein [Alphaproteobacteria bacterium]QQS56478.1 MAG: hypothetical protein IPN28_09310 [Alphaproteobacteria bacterium]
MHTALKIVSVLFLLVAIYIIFSVTLSCIVNYYQLNNSAKALLKEVLKIEDFHTRKAYIHSWFLNPGGRWHVILDEGFDAAKSNLPSAQMKVADPSDVPLPDEYIRRLFDVNFDGYECYSGFDLKLGPESICSAESPSVCNITICAKQGDKNLFITISPF